MAKNKSVAITAYPPMHCTIGTGYETFHTNTVEMIWLSLIHTIMYKMKTLLLWLVFVDFQSIHSFRTIVLFEPKNSSIRKIGTKNIQILLKNKVFFSMHSIIDNLMNNLRLNVVKLKAVKNLVAFFYAFHEEKKFLIQLFTIGIIWAIIYSWFKVRICNALFFTRN